MDIVIEGLTKRFGEQTAVDGISFTVRTGEVLGFLGPNGAGKSTTMKTICGLLPPDAGTVRVGPHLVTERPDEVRRIIGYLPENNPLHTDMPVLDYLRFMATLQGVPGRDIPSRIAEMVRACGLDAEKHKRIGELSKGYRQRVGLAQAMVHDPQVLILDEPTSGLDPNQIVEIRELIRSLGRERTVILSTHILPEVEATCDRILIIHHGRIVADGRPGELLKRLAGHDIIDVQVRDAADAAVAAALTELPMLVTLEHGHEAGSFLLQCEADSDAAAAVYRMCVKHGWTLTRLNHRDTRLEEVFRGLTLETPLA